MYSQFMPAHRLTIDAIRAELAWVNETPDPNKCGCRIFDVAKKLATNLADVPDPPQRSFGRFGGSIFVDRVVIWMVQATPGAHSGARLLN